MTTIERIHHFEQIRSKLRRKRKRILAEMDYLASEEILLTEQILNLKLSCPPTLEQSATNETPSAK